MIENIQEKKTIIYDVTRLVTRGLNNAPNGIDRVDFSLARFFLGQENKKNRAFVYTLFGPRLVPAEDALKTLNLIESYWGENNNQKNDELFNEIVKKINLKENKTKRFNLSDDRIFEKLKLNLISAFDWVIRSGQRLETISDEAIYINVSQFLLDKDWFIKHIVSNKNIKPIFYVHDLIPLDHPEYFLKKEVMSFEKKIKNINFLAKGIISGSKTVLDYYKSHFQNDHNLNLKTFVYRPEIPKSFILSDNRVDNRIDCPYFVMCGTIEPRKNYLRLLNIWKEIALTPLSPKLIIIGKRGWLNEEIISQIERSKILQPFVIEIEGLSTPHLAQLLRGARALLAPSFSEGYGLPVAEAIAAQTPVIASDIEIFREIGLNSLDYINPIDSKAWLEAIQDYSSPTSLRRREAILKIEKIYPYFTKSHLNELMTFIESI